MASTTESPIEVAPEVEVPAPEIAPASAGQTSDSVRSFYRLAGGRLVSCEPNEAQIIAFVSPTIDDEADLQEHYNIDYHTLQSSLDPDELSRLELEPDHAAIIFKRPKSFCADDNFLMKLTSTGVFVYKNYLVIVMADDSPIFEGRVPFPVETIHGVILRLLYQATMHFEGHLKAINMLSDSLERRINISLENKYLLNMFALEKSLVYIVNSITSNGSLLERMKALSEKLGFDGDQVGVLEDLIIENQQCYRRADIHTQVLSNLMGTRASIVSHNLNQLIKKFTIWTVAIMLANLVISVFSMNVALPLPMEEAWWPFVVINVLAVIAGGLIFWLSRWKKW
ncbi:MAG TPA: magnesium transporter CorA family protein [Terrimicrobiaceae bacterium]